MAKIIGHRGASGYAPENTLQSFQEAIRLGCDGTEMDVRLTKDKELVVIHAENIDRVANGQGLVRSYVLEDLRKFKCENGESIPLLQEVIDLCKGKIDLQIEMKEEGTPVLVNEQILKNQMESRVVVSSFDKKLLKEIRDLNPRLVLCHLFREEPDWEFVEKNNINIVGPKENITSQELVDKAHQRGLKVYSYHTNKQARGQALIEMGVDRIGTDYPKLFL